MPPYAASTALAVHEPVVTAPLLLTTNNAAPLEFCICTASPGVVAAVLTSMPTPLVAASTSNFAPGLVVPMPTEPCTIIPLVGAVAVPA